MQIHQQQENREDEEEAFIRFIDFARKELWPVSNESVGKEHSGPGWSWIATQILNTCIAYSSGVTAAILLSDLFQVWNEQFRNGAPNKQPKCVIQSKQNHKRAKLADTVTIDSIYEKNFLSLSAVIEAVVVDAFFLPGTEICMLTLGDFWSSNTIDLYLHRRFYNLANSDNGILKQGREVFLTGCHLRAASGGCAHPRLLPTDYLVILLDEDLDDDAMFLGAQFFSDSFTSISLDAFNKGASYLFYAKIESIGPLEIQGKYGNLQRKQVTLIDNDGVRLDFCLWGEQAQLVKLFSVGCMLALDKPFVANSLDSALEAREAICLEYGSSTQLYLVPFIQHEEQQVCLTLSQSRCHGSRLLCALGPTQASVVSQVTLPCDSQGSINFSNYPFRFFVADINEKMASISLYGVVTDIIKEKDTSDIIFTLRIEDTTGSIHAKLHFSTSWSLGRLGPGHTIYLTGLTSSLTKQKQVELLWFESEIEASFVNISCLPALLNSSCLHKLSCIDDLSVESTSTHICRVWLDQIEHCHVKTKFSHSICGQFVDKAPGGSLKCSFCHCNCNTEVVRNFHLQITLADESAKVFAWCSGQTASELLQISPGEFCELPEEEQIMYPSSLEHERFIVAIVNGRPHGDALSGQEKETVTWEITRALKCE